MHLLDLLPEGSVEQLVLVFPQEQEDEELPTAWHRLQQSLLSFATPALGHHRSMPALVPGAQGDHTVRQLSIPRAKGSIFLDV
jgi:hypothetical protein